jgi:hypothetical protein
VHKPVDEPGTLCVLELTDLDDQTLRLSNPASFQAITAIKRLDETRPTGMRSFKH